MWCDFFRCPCRLGAYRHHIGLGNYLSLLAKVAMRVNQLALVEGSKRFAPPQASVTVWASLIERGCNSTCAKKRFSAPPSVRVYQLDQVAPLGLSCFPIAQLAQAFIFWTPKSGRSIWSISSLPPRSPRDLCRRRLLRRQIVPRNGLRCHA